VSLLAAPLAAVTTPAHAAARCSIDNFSPRTIVIGLSPVKAKIRPSISGCTVQGWNLSSSSSFYTFDSNPEAVFYPPFSNSVKAEDVVASAYNEDFEVTNRIFNNAFTIKRNILLDNVNATPEPVRKGAKITIKGRLRIADWTNDRYVGLTKKGVTLESRPLKGGEFVRVKSATTGTGGNVTASVTAGSDRCYRFHYSGASDAPAKNSAADCVDVR
jgi:hypothetical protein